jgi:hypothetical protein
MAPDLGFRPGGCLSSLATALLDQCVRNPCHA